jgi:hypothetical protein
MYLIDVGKLSSEQHQQSLSASYLAWVNAENAKVELLSSQAKTELAGLLGSLGAIRAGVSGLATPPEKLGVVSPVNITSGTPPIFSCNFRIASTPVLSLCRW